MEQQRLFQILELDGTLRDDNMVINEKLAMEMYKLLVLNRIFDRKLVNMQRKGQIGTYASFEGQEASQVGSAMALLEQDWMFPTYRDHAAMLTFGYEMVKIIWYWMGRIEGCIPPNNRNILPPYVPIATQIPQAAGAAWASKYKNESACSLAYFGDGATSEGDFHEGLNMASVFKAPVVFFCQNNGYAISVPLSRQTASETIAQKAIAYDMNSIRIDGNDVFAVYVTTKNALEAARSGKGPTLIEAVTYRYGPHTTADDPSRYRSSEESESWRSRDPILRLEAYLRRQGLLDQDTEEKIHREADRLVNDGIQYALNIPKPDPTIMFKNVLSEKPWNIQEQESNFNSFMERYHHQ
ncbi:pyruvate dehydrogenase (acetyl-transferring) E1 component subunit alpha [Paenibacillus sp. ACRRX]|uniref:pyruvate dehydrogenase (acetyl-transferring) E1 component subunit alpha n=1 Tax=unclassified Paenibacillus TaxID=185978 RepID=UPI001EF60452|nr:MULTISPECIES: pyruvate dehydrogenase (acetyl-transferring) E1 component subunit alpha [unclassified Paenibacillus]MCG7407070.1 pyruvate dehydrogenase (acetyl-transferring) E1 component subunit alpha [Paenibacillus sp. ACRRX]MDK8180290.1 pyruvate dehydrogenase (acetyl-transferring) E1 component subunit alpha [Paenibacillus sp. UMB4589-SE434]